MTQQQIPERFIKFIDAAKQLSASGQKVTYAAVMAAAGGRGSMTDVAAAIKLWKEGRDDAAQLEVVQHELPDDEKSQALQVLGALWHRAETQAQSVLNAERQALEQLRTEIEDEKAQALEAADSAIAENDALKARVLELEALLASSSQDALAAKTKLEAVESTLSDVRAELAGERELRIKAEAKAGTADLLEQLLERLGKK